MPDFALDAENAPAVAQICARLDGIPLAIELAAARVKVLTLEQILTRLDDRFRLLSGGNRTALPRQQTLGALIDWSYDLLSEPERTLLRRLSVFVAGRTLEMAEDVCAGEGLDRDQIFDLLSALVEKSLLTVEPGQNGESRYTMLESVWDYGEEKLAQHQESARYRRKHLEYFARLAESGEPALFGQEQKSWLEKFSIEHYNLNAALRFTFEQSETIELGLRLAGALSRYWEVHSYLTEGYEQIQTLLVKADPALALAIRAKAELGAGRLSWCQDRDADALRHYRAAQTLYRDLANVEQVGIIEALLGFTERNDGNNSAARTHFERANAIGKELCSKRIMAMAGNGLGSLAADEGDFAGARAAKERSLVSFRSLGDQWVVALITGSLGRVCYQEGDYAAAKIFLQESLLSVRDLGNKWAVPYAIEALADICAKDNQATKAVRLYGAASAVRESLALSFSTSERAAYTRALERLHEHVANGLFEREWLEGRSLGLPAAIDLAMS
jgi:tetratricopeptide (TPR) repeat protein